MNSSGWSRRGFLRAGAASATGLGLAAVGAGPAPGARKRIPVALQLYSVRNDAAKDLPGVLEAVAKMGYEGVEFAGYYDHKPEAVRKMLDSNGLKCAGTHTGFGALEGDALSKTVDLHKILGATFIMVPGGIGGKTKQGWLDAARQFTEIAAVSQFIQCGKCLPFLLNCKVHQFNRSRFRSNGPFNLINGDLPIVY